MSGTETLITFLQSRGSQRGDLFTHTSFGNTNVLPGRIFIGEDELERFYELYVEWVDVQKNKVCLTECNTDISPLRIDLDFLYELSVDRNQHTKDQLVSLVQHYLEEASKYLQIVTPTDVYVMEKRKPNRKGQYMSGGVHVLVPSICTNKWIEIRIRDNMLTYMNEIFGNLPLVEKDWSKVYDRAVTSRSANWMVYGAQKSDGLPYLIKYVMTYDPVSKRVAVSERIPEFNEVLLKSLSVRVTDPLRETLPTDLAREEYGHPSSTPAIHTPGGRAVTPARGRPISRNERPSSRESSPNGQPRQRPLTEEEKTYYYRHTMNLSEKRYNDYAEWVSVGQCLWNIHPVDLHDVWHEFSAQSPKYRFKDADAKWSSFTYLIDGTRLSKKSLLYWSRTDNPEQYADIEKRNVDAMIEQSLSGTEYDVAQVVHAKFHHEYCCASYSKDVWFKFSGHIWTETDKGVDLLCKLSDDIWKMYNRKRAECANALSDLPACTSKVPDGCQTCKMTEKETQYTKMCRHLKTTAFKSNVMKECRLLFLDPEFVKKVNENPNLIAFKNGVFDLETMEFRNGKQEDYIMFNTNIEYHPELHYTQCKAWPDVDKFLKQILPEEDVCDYVSKFLSTCLKGTNMSQKFHIWTGTGANGKSMLMNLMETAMGDYACKAPITIFTQSRQKTGTAAPDVVKLRGKRWVSMAEPDEGECTLNMGTIKDYTSGEKVTARDLFSKASEILEFLLQCKFNLSCNDLPKVVSTDAGTWRRLVQLRFTAEFRPANQLKPGQHLLDETIQLKVRSTEWATAFMTYLIHIYKTNNGCANLQPPERIIAYTNEYREENDSIARFMRDCLRPVQENEEGIIPVRQEALAEAFKTWKMQKEEFRVRLQDMTKRVESIYGKYPKGSRNVQGGWRNFQIVDTD